MHNVDAPMLVLFPEIKEIKKSFSYFLISQKDSKLQKDFASMFQPSLFLKFIVGVFFFCFSQQTLPNTPSREGKLSVHQHFDASGTYFFQRRV